MKHFFMALALITTSEAFGQQAVDTVSKKALPIKTVKAKSYAEIAKSVETSKQNGENQADDKGMNISMSTYNASILKKRVPKKKIN